LREAQGYFEQALAIDPTLTRASEGLLLAYLNLVYVGAVPSMTGWPRVRRLAEDTLRLDPRSVFAHSALAWVYAYYDYDRAGCNREIEAALATRTRDPVALMYTAWMAAVVRRMDDAERLIHQSLIIDPLSPDAYEALGAILRDSGDFAGAERAFRQNLVISPSFAGTHVYLAEVLFFRNQFTDALTEANAEAPGAARQAVLAGIHSALGHRRESDALLAHLIRSSDDTYWIAVAYTMRGEKDQAFATLDRAYARHDLSLHTPSDPIFASLRADPRWAALMARMNLLE
jgi:tetratricopeptide (TPR) repeat protein